MPAAVASRRSVPAILIIGMEHGNSMKGKEGERAVIQAYRDADRF